MEMVCCDFRAWLVTCKAPNVVAPVSAVRPSVRLSVELLNNLTAICATERPTDWHTATHEDRAEICSN